MVNHLCAADFSVINRRQEKYITSRKMQQIKNEVSKNTEFVLKKKSMNIGFFQIS